MSLFLNELPLAEYRHKQDKRALERREGERRAEERLTWQSIAHANALEEERRTYDRREGEGRRAWDGAPLLG